MRIADRMPTLNTMTAAEHVPVLAPELVELLDPQPGEAALDCTFGAGGHARLVAERLGAGRLAGLRRPRPRGRGALRRAGRARSSARRASCAPTSPTRSTSWRPPGERFDVAYMDLGISSLQLDSAAPRVLLRLRRAARHAHGPRPGAVGRARSSTTGPPSASPAALREYGEERHARAIAAEIVRRRPLRTTFELVDAIRAAVPPSYRFGRGHPAKRTFQAIRIAVNGELESLDRALPGAWALLRRRGAARRDLLPLARGPARQALPRRSRPRVHLPAGAAGLRVPPRARGRAADPARDRRLARGGGAQPALALGAPARRPQAAGAA